ncbi:MAG: hypothetical protein COA66_09905 [Arcobacter sp.]|nr:MAG: hypothetical protein COA66_09905 [Arcobacter sp.]
MKEGNKNYQKSYKKIYKEKYKIVTFPLSNIFYEQLRKNSVCVDTSTNTFAKNILTSYLNNTSFKILTKEQKDYIKEYVLISRGIANNINQIAYKSNINEQIDINILINSLKSYEEAFKKFISKI